jgi:hypothetical protein
MEKIPLSVILHPVLIFKSLVISQLINSIWNKEELPDQHKESIIVPIHMKCDKTDCSNYRGISLLLTLYKILSNILLSKLSPYMDEIIGDHQCGFRRNRSTTDNSCMNTLINYVVHPCYSNCSTICGYYSAITNLLNR